MDMPHMQHLDNGEKMDGQNGMELDHEDVTVSPLLPTQPISDTEHVDHETDTLNNDDVIKHNDDMNVSPMKRKSSISHGNETNNNNKDNNDGSNDNDNNDNNDNNNPPQSPTKRSKQELLLNTELKYFDHDLVLGTENAPFTLKPLNEDNLVNENSKVIMSSLFLPYQNEVTLDQILSNEISIEGDEDNDGTNKKSIIDKDEINIDVPIDDNGQTALHLAATLGKISLVEELINKHANRFRGDNEGQTALIRVVHTTNCFELLCFSELLDLLYPTITLLDNRGRTILHHIAISCGLKGRYDSSKYYLETLLEWVVKKGNKVKSNNSLTLTNFIKDVVNKSDKYGNTCLNYATLAGNKYIVSQLLDIGADPYKANKIGVTPGDYGIDVDSTINNGFLSTFKDPENFKDINDGKLNSINEKIKIENKSNAIYSDGENDKINTNRDNNNSNGDDTNNRKDHGDNNVNNKLNSGSEFKEKFNSLEILDSMQKFIDNIGKEFREEMNEKYEQIDRLNPILKEKTLELSYKRKQYDELQNMIGKITKMNNKIENLNKAIEEEEREFQSEIQNLTIDINQDNCLGEFDADQPFTIVSLYEDVEKIVEQLLQENIEKSQKDEKNTDNNNDNNNDNEINDENIDELEILKNISVNDILKHYQKDNIEEIIKDIPPSVVLDARIRAYKENNSILEERMKQRKNLNKELEAQFRRIIGICINTDPKEIDDKLLSSLLLSVENDPDPELGQIRKVLQIVGEIGDDGSER
ncbi:transcriptional regulator [Pichia kluyveri]|uniref:Transcriptional regulator n=1 Tax=Pichia kluyveri TaxID=36015 RepID=A0AAV5R2F6_PICKL|nr:transcriptional regulator [Pichia kluyveri]